MHAAYCHIISICSGGAVALRVTSHASVVVLAEKGEGGGFARNDPLNPKP